ncbi:hypothetical protein DFP73DRAFT_591485 [Morchella snyderi]|nr:hypothetical protein DFP73DRAFT_591485 [Morchella snyderi]
MGDSHQDTLSALRNLAATHAWSKHDPGPANSPLYQGAASTPWAPGAPGAARAECSRLAMPKHSDHARHRQGRVAAPGDARVERSRPATSEHTTFSPFSQSRAFKHPAPPEQNVRFRCAREVCSRPALPDQNTRVQRCQSKMIVSAAPRAVCSRRALPEQNPHFRRSQSSVVASGAASASCSRGAATAEYSFPLLHATSQSQSTGSTQYRRIHPPSGDHTPILYLPAAARAFYSRPLSTP